jgi:hypothetical protein
VFATSIGPKEGQNISKVFVGNGAKEGFTLEVDFDDDIDDDIDDFKHLLIPGNSSPQRIYLLKNLITLCGH